MIRKNLILDLNSELIMDNFAGGGGASTGIERALGRHVDHAINHDEFALGMHRINHAQTVHHCEDVFDMNPAQLTEGRPVGMGWFSPDCKHFSKAKGGKPLSKKIRGLAFVILRWAKIRTRVIYMENVEEIKTWGPLLANGKPNPEHKGRTWNSFLAALSTGLDASSPDMAEILDVLGNMVTKDELIRGFGYEVQTKELRACDFGTPTIRKRLFLIARCDGRPIVWPERTHFNPAARGDARPTKNLKPWVPVSTCIDWDIPCHSIFLPPVQAKKVRCRRPLAASTMRRIATGIDRYVLKSAKPFLVSLTHQGSDRIEAIDEPVKTLTGAHRGEKALVATNMAVMTSKHTGGQTDEPLKTVATGGHHAVVSSKLAPFFTEHANASNQRNNSVEKPMPTQCAEVKGGHFALVGATVVSKHSKDKPVPVDVPIGSASSRDSFAVAAATMVQTGYGENVNQKPRALDVEKPLGTIVSGGKHAVVAAHLTKFVTGAVGQSPDKPLPAITAGSHAEDTHGGAASVHGLVAANIVKFRGDPETHFPAKDADKPLDTVSAAGLHHGVCAAYLAQHNGGFNTNPGHEATEPVSTISQKGSQQQVVAGNLVAYYGNDKDGQGVEEPARTVTVRERFGHVQSEMVSPLTEEQIAGASQVAKFLRDHAVVFEGEFATLTVDGVQFVIVDIGMRMLTARELFRAQGFGNQYIIDHAWLVNPKTGELKDVKLTKEQQIRMCGNSVCPDVAEAIVRANSGDLAIWNLKDRKKFQKQQLMAA